MTEIIKIMEIIGTIAFALSGALVAISSHLDVFGVSFLACITAFGGGVLRDLILGITPPAIFNNLPVFMLALVVAVLTFIVAYIFRNEFDDFKIRIERINNVFDAVGLSAFVVMGSEVACTNGFIDNGFIVVFCGMVTGVGGGIFRDILIDTTPYVFKKHVYAMAAIIGGIAYFIIRIHTLNIKLASLISILLVFSIRMLATKYRWSLPKITYNHYDDTK